MCTLFLLKCSENLQIVSCTFCIDDNMVFDHNATCRDNKRMRILFMRNTGIISITRFYTWYCDLNNARICIALLHQMLYFSNECFCQWQMLFLDCYSAEKTICWSFNQNPLKLKYSFKQMCLSFFLNFRGFSVLFCFYCPFVCLSTKRFMYIQEQIIREAQNKKQ